MVTDHDVKHKLARGNAWHAGRCSQAGCGHPGGGTAPGAACNATVARRSPLQKGLRAKPKDSLGTLCTHVGYEAGTQDALSGLAGRRVQTDPMYKDRMLTTELQNPRYVSTAQVAISPPQQRSRDSAE